MYIAPGIKNRCSRANNSKVNDPIRLKFELVPAFTPVLITCKFDKDPIKGDWEKLETSFFFHRWRADNSKMTGHIRPKFKPVRDFMSVLISCKFDEVWIHSNWEKMETQFSPIQSQWKCSRAYNSVGSGPIWQKFELVLDFMHVLVTCKYKKDQIKNNREKVETLFSPL